MLTKLDYISRSSIFVSILIFFSLTLYFFIEASLLNIIYPFIIIIFIPTLFLLQLVNIKIENYLFTPICWFLIACFFYHGIGPLIYIWGSDYAKSIDLSVYNLNEFELLKTNLLNIISISSILLIFSLSLKLKKVNFVFKKMEINNLILFCILLFFTGIFFKYIAYFIRDIFGDDFLMPGFLYILSDLLYGSIFISTYLFLKYKNKLALFILIITFFIMFFDVFSYFMISKVISYIIPFILVFFIFFRSIKIFILFMFLSFSLINLLEVFKPTFRNVVEDYNLNGEGITTLYKFIPTSFSEIHLNKGDQPLWRRISLNNSQALAMKFFDEGNKGNTFETIKWAFVPRIIYPKKPIITHGDEFTILTTGNNNAGGTSPGFFGEGYWNNGWYGVAFMTIILGIFMAFFTKINLSIVENEFWHFTPIVLLSINSSYTIEGWFIASTINNIPFYIIYFVIPFLYLFFIKLLKNIK
jgi:hypothetical protein